MTKRTVVITGASRGLGYETARQLARAGHRVVLTARTEEQARDAAASLNEESSHDPIDLHPPIEIVPRALDVVSDESVAAFFDWLGARESGLDVLINNAGRVFEAKQPNTLEVPAATVQRSFDNNTLGAYRMLQRALPIMNRRGYGRVVNVSSGMGGIAEMDSAHPAYRISKAALNAVTRLFHHEAAPNVLVNSVCPGWVRTEMGGEGADRSVPEGVAGIVWAATLDDDGPSGGFFRDGQKVPW